MHLFARQIDRILLLALVVVALAAFAQDKPVAPLRLRTAAMTNADIFGLTAAGIDADIIVSKIRSAPSTAFDTSVDALKALKAAGVANDVIFEMVAGGTPPSTSKTTPAVIDLSDFKEPVVKEGLWEVHQTTTMRPGDPPVAFTRTTCHSHLHDHEEFQRLKSSGNGSDSACTMVKASTKGESSIIEERCQGQGTTSSMTINWTIVDEDHTRSDVAIVYSQPIKGGIRSITTAGEGTFKGPCPAGMEAGDMVGIPLSRDRKQSNHGH